MDLYDILFAKSLGGGGGGGTADAVKYTPQTLTLEQQTQARKNLDLYYKENTTIADWDGDTSGVVSCTIQGVEVYKISDYYFEETNTDILSFYFNDGVEGVGVEKEYESIGDIKACIIKVYHGFNLDYPQYVFYSFSDAVESFSVPEAGIYVPKTQAGLYIASINGISYHGDLEDYLHHSFYVITVSHSGDYSNITSDHYYDDIDQALKAGKIPIVLMKVQEVLTSVLYLENIIPYTGMEMMMFASTNECVYIGADAAMGLQLQTLPQVTAADNGKILQVNSGYWQAVSISNAEEVSY